MKSREHRPWQYRNLTSGEVLGEARATTPAELAEREEAERLNRELVLIPIGEPGFEQTAPDAAPAAFFSSSWERT